MNITIPSGTLPVGANNVPAREAVPVRNAASQAAQAAAPPPKQEVRREEVEAAAKAIQEFVKPMAQNLQFTVDPDLGATVIRVVDTATNEVIRQIPSEEMLQIAKAINSIQGLLIKQQA